jgi:hypothetical protein
LNGALLTIPNLKTTFQQHWERWKRKRTWYGNTARWWNICAKREIQRFFKFLGKERAQDTKQHINFYYFCLYDLLQKPADFPDLNIKLKYHKAKTIHLYRTQQQHFKAETRESTFLDDEHLSLYNIVARHKRRQNKCITTILDNEGVANTTQWDIQNIFLSALQDRFAPYQYKSNKRKDFTQQFNKL